MVSRSWFAAVPGRSLPHLHAEITVGVLPQKCRDGLVTNLGGEGLYIASTRAAIDDGKTAALPHVEGEARPVCELLDEVQGALQVLLGG